MDVPPAFAETHTLLTESIGEMVGAIEILDGIAKDPSTATVAKADDMTAKAENGEKLAGEYVQELERILNEKYPQLLEE